MHVLKGWDFDQGILGGLAQGRSHDGGNNDYHHWSGLQQ